MKRIIGVAVLSLAVAGFANDKKENYEIGGPLAGVKLPLYPTYHGEAPGKPGNSRGKPQYQLYPGSVENWRAYYFKYCPVRSIFDVQSQLKNWTSPEIPGCSSRQIEKYAQPVYKANKTAGATATGKFEPAVKVTKIKPGDTILETSLGKLKRGLYCIRVIAAVPTKEVTEYRKDLFATLEVNDKANGGTSRYRKRIAYVDQFYSIIELYFHAPETRKYKVKLSIGSKSKIGLIVRNVSFDDVLTDFVRRPIKKKSNQPLSQEAVKKYNKWLREVSHNKRKLKQRQELDDIIWNGWPGLNIHYNGMIRPGGQSFRKLMKNIRYGTKGMDYKALDKKYGKWNARDLKDFSMLTNNKKLKLAYSVDDLRAGKTLPAPYPVKDDGTGVSQPDADGIKGCFYAPIAETCLDRIRTYQKMLNQTALKLSSRLHQRDFADKVHSSLLAFARFVYDYPTLDPANDLGMIISRKGPYYRQGRTRQRMTTPWFLTWYTEFARHVELYDKFYDLIKDNQMLADSIGRHIPWVKSPQDVIELFDTYLVQNTARRILRYQYHTGSGRILIIATVLGDKDITTPWLENLFSKSFIYPQKLMGIQHIAINGYDRSGLGFGGASSFYGTGKNTTPLAASMDKYCKSVNDDTFSLSNPKKYPKVAAACYWPIELMYAGYQFARIGDVSGSDKLAGALLTNSMQILRPAWRWTKDPQLAAVLYHAGNRSLFTDKEWAEICKQAAIVKRMPYLTQPSRFVPNWCGIIETGKRHDDFRFRRGAMVRVGYNHGHAHNDSLDLQLSAHGIQMAIDAGQRPGYCSPGASYSAVHNTVTVNGKQRAVTTGWISNIVDGKGLAYLFAHAGRTGAQQKGARQVMLVDVDDNGPAKRLALSKQQPRAKLKKVQQTPNGYIFDVFRENRTGKLRYNFHAMNDDHFEWNALAEKANPKAFNGIFKKFPKRSFSAKAPKTLVATWQMRKVPQADNKYGSEMQVLGKNFVPGSPNKYLRLHLLGVEGALAERGAVATVKANIKNDFTCIGAEVNDPNGRVFTAIAEPYVGKPFIKSVELIDIADNEDDALAATAAKVVTVNGNTDWNFADGRPGKTRKFDGITVSGEAAIMSVDKDGLRQAMLTGGTVFKTPYVKIKLAVREYKGKIASVSYPNRTITLDATWPEMKWPQVISIGNRYFETGYTVIKAEKTKDGKTKLTVKRGADLYISPIKEIDTANKRVFAKLRFTPGHKIAGRTITNSRQDKSWKAGIDGKLNGAAPVTKESFAPENIIKAWEYGPADNIKLASKIVITRNSKGSYDITSNANGAVSLFDKKSGKWTEYKVKSNQ
jgi:hypothetical protein